MMLELSTTAYALISIGDAVVLYASEAVFDSWVR